MSTQTILICAKAARDALIAAESDIESLDRAIGDGDHFHNVKRGADTLIALAPDIADKPADQALKAIGMKLLSTIGGASGPLISSFFLAAARTPGAGDDWTAAQVAAMVSDGVAAIQKRGKAELGDKTMLDVLIPVAETLRAGAAAGDDPATLRAKINAAAEAGVEATRNIRAAKGRAAFLGERAIGHIDPGAMSSMVMIRAVCAASAPR